jgi:hypothetical protein
MNLDSLLPSGRRLLFVAASVLVCCAFAAGQYESLYSFQGGSDGWEPLASLVADKAGNLYGTTFYGGNTSGPYCFINGCGTVFQLQPPASPAGTWTKTILYNFAGNPDGYFPSVGPLILDKAGNLYGTTQFGGSGGYGYGTIFQLSPPAEQGDTWTETILYNFTDGNDGGVPANGVIADAAGNLYGTTNDGGQYGQQGVGTAFQLAPPLVADGAWTETTLVSFKVIKDGDEPNQLTFGGDGIFYGSRSADNILCTPSYPKYCGSVFELRREGSNWRMQTIHQFTGADDGSSPSSVLIFDKKGNLYGTTVGFGGNTTTGGTVFELTPPTGSGSWTETLLYNFTGESDGGAPLGNLIFGPKGNLYDTTFYGGDLSCNLGLGCGVVFQLAPPSQPNLTWTETVLHIFGNGHDGQDPTAGVIVGEDSVLFGTASGGGGSSSCNGGCGTVFDIKP